MLQSMTKVMSANDYSDETEVTFKKCQEFDPI